MMCHISLLCLFTSLDMTMLLRVLRELHVLLKKHCRVKAMPSHRIVVTSSIFFFFFHLNVFDFHYPAVGYLDAIAIEQTFSG